MARRRRVTGRPLLVASAGAAMSVGCGGLSREVPPVGNLVIPPEPVVGEVCVEVTPADATVSLNGEVVSARCGYVPAEGKLTVEVSAPGYLTETIEFVPGDPIDPDPVKVDLTPAPPPPIGNLVPPPEVLIAPPPPPPPPRPTLSEGEPLTIKHAGGVARVLVVRCPSGEERGALQGEAVTFPHVPDEDCAVAFEGDAPGGWGPVKGGQTITCDYDGAEATWACEPEA